MSAITAVILLSLPHQAKALDSELYSNLQSRLAKATTEDDSIKLMYDILDVSLDASSARDSIALKLIRFGDVHENESISYDAYRRLANFHSSDIQYLDSLISSINERGLSDDKKITLTFITMLRNSAVVRSISEKTKTEKVIELVHDFRTNPNPDTYERIARLHAICIFLADCHQDDLLVKYTDRLGGLVESLPEKAYPIKNQYYVQAAMSYAQTAHKDKSVAADRKLLKIIDTMQKKYLASGRRYINYDANRYVIYSRLLSNFEVLSPADIEHYHSEAIRLAGNDSRARATYNKYRYPDIYYALHNADYTTALDLIKTVLPEIDGAWKRRAMLRHMIDCAEALDRKDDLIYALKKYSDETDLFLINRIPQRYMEMQINYDVYDLKNKYEDLSIEKVTTEEKLSTRYVATIIISAIAMLIAIVILFFLYRHSRRLSAKLRDSNRELIAERDKLREQTVAVEEARRRAEDANIMRSNFIKSLSYEITPSLQAITEYSHVLTDFAAQNEKEYIRGFVDIIDQNCELLRTLAHDVVTLSEIEDTCVEINNTPVDINSIIPVTIETMQSAAKKNIEIKFKSSVENSIMTDPQRVQQVMAYLLSNAIKFSDENDEIEVKADTIGRNIAISVTDTGIGIEPKYKEKIFERFYKISKNTPGAGLGLHIARNIARLLGGNIRLDTAYTRGARFIFTLPFSPA